MPKTQHGLRSVLSQINESAKDERDPLNQASRLEELDRAVSMAELALPTRFPEPPDELTDETGYHRYCVNCGIEIPALRIAALPFCVRCTTCQSLKETRDKQYAPARSRYPDGTL